MNTLHHRRTQFPVGEGLFHAGLLSSGSGERLTYVYDCGSQQMFATQRAAAIAEYRDRIGDWPLDVLFLSHAHADHVNGVPDLLDALEVGTIVIPLLGVYERLVAFARSLAHRDRPDGFVEDWTVDPVAAVAGQGAARVVVVRPSGPGAAPPYAGPDFDPDGESDLEPDWDPQREPRDWDDPVETSNGPDRVGVGRPWDFVGPGGINYRPSAGPFGTTSVIEIPDTVGIRPRLAGGTPPWILATHISPSLFAKRKSFFDALAHETGRNRSTIETELLDVHELRRLVVVEPRALLAAYRVVRSDVNLTSMSLYSGPYTKTRRARCWAGRSWPNTDHRWRGRLRGWIGTGDARLSARGHRRALLEHLDPLLPNVQTATLAHHGADNGFSEDLLTSIPARYWVAPAAPYHNWQHPHPDVERAVELAGRHVVHVDEDTHSVFEEDFRLSLR